MFHAFRSLLKRNIKFEKFVERVKRSPATENAFDLLTNFIDDAEPSRHT